MPDGLIDAIYEAPLASRPWHALLGSLRRFANADLVMLKLSQGDDGAGARILTDAPDAAGTPVDRYRSFYQHRDPVPYAAMAAGDLCQFDDLIQRRELVASDYYREFCAPLGIEHAFFFHLGRHQGLDVWLNGSRGRGAGRFSPRETRAIRGLFPHLVRAAEIHCRLEASRDEADVYADALGRLGIGVLLLDPHGAIRAATPRADEILALCRARERGGAVLDAIAGALRGLAGEAPPPWRLATIECGAAPVRMLVKRAAAAGAANSPGFAVYLEAGPPPLPGASDALVAAGFGLTPAEARLAVQIANGRSLEQAAPALGVTANSARTYSKRLLSKTGCARQAELVRLLRGGLAHLV